MGRKRLEVPNQPVSASIPPDLHARLRSECAIQTPASTWQHFITRILELGLRAHLQGQEPAQPESEDAVHE